MNARVIRGVGVAMSALGATIAFVLTTGASPTAGSETTGLAQPASVADRLSTLRSLARSDPSGARTGLRRLDPETMEPEDRDAWYDIARSVALRTGDREWLLELGEHRSEFSEVDVYRVLLAGGMLEEGRIDEARAELAEIEDLEAVNVRDRRRAYAIQARLALLDRDLPGERAAIEKIVHELQYWATPSCQRCHDNASDPDAIPLLDVRSAWYGRRFVELMIQQGDADSVRADAQTALDADPANLDARLHLAYALVALEREDEADEAFTEVPWMKIPGREGVLPRMMMPYP